ncbi:hypothetical protein AOQ84DRAFT_32815 [Glonium stellatum]|uniref:Uncharacterized protein n=1 Tax=Glonium stellatum TaxID=574774 RepID=A0A8E2F1I1_9PEZI|nr:hypothetical protein AOQ84DRAFT_32815 [Glonium stellatum]
MLIFFLPVVMTPVSPSTTQTPRRKSSRTKPTIPSLPTKRKKPLVSQRKGRTTTTTSQEIPHTVKPSQPHTRQQTSPRTDHPNPSHIHHPRPHHPLPSALLPPNAHNSSCQPAASAPHASRLRGIPIYAQHSTAEQAPRGRTADGRRRGARALCGGRPDNPASQLSGAG